VKRGVIGAKKVKHAFDACSVVLWLLPRYSPHTSFKFIRSRHNQIYSEVTQTMKKPQPHLIPTQQHNQQHNADTDKATLPSAVSKFVEAIEECKKRQQPCNGNVLWAHCRK
jgi:hypothetical protein